VDPAACREKVARVWGSNRLELLSKHEVEFGRASINWQPKLTLPLHSNGMTFTAVDQNGAVLDQDDFYSVGGGFFVDREGLETNNALAKVRAVKFVEVVFSEIRFCRSASGTGRR
jgi:L-serine dehydratase